MQSNQQKLRTNIKQFAQKFNPLAGFLCVGRIFSRGGNLPPAKAICRPLSAEVVPFVKSNKGVKLLYKEITEYAKSGIYPFHMPGHKRNPDFMPKNLLDLDMTEVFGMDVLSNPTGIIRHLQEKIAAFYGARQSFLLTNGSTGGLVAAICAAHAAGRQIFAPRNAHVSFFGAAALCGAYPAYYLPDMLPGGLCGGVGTKNLRDMPQGAAVLVISPTYEGFTSDIQAIASFVHAKDGLLIVDAAHGAHFAFHESFPTCATRMKADIVIHSLHKTLPALGQTALLHLCSKRMDTFLLGNHINFVQTTSPSYMMMAVCDFMFDRPHTELFHAFCAKLCDLRSGLPGHGSNAALALVGCEVLGAVADFDISKLLFRVHPALATLDIADKFAQLKIGLEMAHGGHVLALSTVADTERGFNLLKNAIASINCDIMESACVLPSHNTEMFLPEVVLTPQQALAQPTELIPWADAHGRICAEVLATYPPGIAVLAPGELVPAGLAPIKPTLRVVK